MSPRPRHALLRDATRWEGVSTTGLEPTVDGRLALTGLPAAAPGEAVDLDGPWEVGASGLIAGEGGPICLSDTAGDRLLCLDPRCEVRTAITGMGLAGPRGLLAVGDRLIVADSGNARLQVFDRSTLALRALWRGPFAEPVALAADSSGRIYVLDAGLNTLLRLDPDGTPDESYAAALAGKLGAPAFLGMGEGDVLFVSDRGPNLVLRFDADGQALGAIDSLQAVLPRALAAVGDRLFVADAGNGAIRAFDLAAGLDLGPLPGFCGPAAALAMDGSGALHVKTDLGRGRVRLPAGAGCVGSGRLESGPLDAGVDQVWERLAVSAEIPEGTAVRLEVHLAADTKTVPTESDWLPTRSLDTLLPPPDPAAQDRAPSARFLWLRVIVTSGDRRSAPILSQVHAATVAPSWMAELPAVYSRADGPDGFLRRLLALFRSELSDLETLLEDMPRRFDPATAQADRIPWLAAWVALDLPIEVPLDRSEARLRDLIAEAHRIYTWRGTRAGLREAIERQTGIRLQILEAYRERRIWQLDTRCRLGFDTGLVPARPDGAVVPDSAESPVVGELVLSEARPQDAAALGESIFADEAHLFGVVLPAGRCIGEAERERLRAVIDREKPAHADYRLCPVEARMRVGFQARIGVDAIVAGPREPLALDVSRLGLDSFAGGDLGAGRGAKLGQGSGIGQRLRVG